MMDVTERRTALRKQFDFPEHAEGGDVWNYMCALEERVLALTADEGPRKAAERIMEEVFFAEPPRATITRLIDAITTAIQAASNAQLERGRKARAMADYLLKEYRQRADRFDHRSYVGEFMSQFRQHIGEVTGWPPQEVLDLRVKLIAEEFAEMLEAGGYEGTFWISRGIQRPDAEPKMITVADWNHEPDEYGIQDFPAFIDALLDLEYVILGTHVACGVDPQPIWERVHASNMAKQPAADKHSKITKPAGWVEPDIAGALKDQGWGGAE